MTATSTLVRDAAVAEGFYWVGQGTRASRAPAPALVDLGTIAAAPVFVARE